MRKILQFSSFLVLVPIFAYSDSIDKQINDISVLENQKNTFNSIKANRENKAPIYTPLQMLQEQEASQNLKCMKINSIILDKYEFISKDDVEKIIAKYKGKCNNIVNLKNLVTEINNLYIKDSFVTSKAYLKPQDLSTGVLRVSIMEGRVEDVNSSSINSNLVFLGYKNKPLNLRDVESRVEQLNSLESIKTTMKLNPGSKVGYTTILVNSKKVSSAFGGSLSINNFGTKKSGRYQISGSLKYENPFNLADVIKISINTTSKQNHDNKSLGSSISYALPIGKAYVEFSSKKLKAHLKGADKQNARYCAVIGENELNSGTIWVKDLVTKEENSLKIEEFLKQYC